MHFVNFRIPGKSVFQSLSPVLGLTLAVFTLPAWALNPDRVQYDIHVDQKTVGTSIISRHQTAKDRYAIEQESTMVFPGLLSDTRISGTLVETFDDQGQLRISDNREQYDDETWWTRIERTETGFLAFRSELTTDEQKEEAELVDLAKMAITHLVPGAGNVMAIGEILLSDDPDQKKADRFGIDSFDSSFLNLPGFWANAGQTLPDSLRIFSTGDVLLYTADISFKGTNTTNLGDATIITHHYILTDRDDTVTEIWLVAGPGKTAWFYKITGTDDGSAFEMLAVPQEQD